MCPFSSFQQRQQSRHISVERGDEGQSVTHPGRSLDSLTFADAAALSLPLYFRLVDQREPGFAVTVNLVNV